MSRLLFDGLVYDSLSGEFQPKCDPQKRSHTLGRLVVATFQKGERYGANDGDITYRPSWAKDVEAHIETRNLTKGLVLLERIELKDIYQDAPWLEIDVDEQSIAINYFKYPLALGQELNTAKTSATLSAQMFFDLL